MADASTLRHFVEKIRAGGHIGADDPAAIEAFGSEAAYYGQCATTGTTYPADLKIAYAVAFKEALLPKWYWRAGHGSQDPGWAHLNRVHPDHCDRLDEAHAVSTEPARALVLAVLKARLALAEARHG
ncbi:hypothetical protein J2X65_003196 [Ancylobacter sp. 3268]|uniref:hypothetical protein n=1 Tax=Ancylobacter sp. 3268 TaxID=2817752 RepID=UPI00285F0FAC|nr:hypothetical protein [Ancylobacter sp. 3268]MDR6953833.1 hypothetical protein [Ancylobacter sp. 3268]